MIAEAVEEVLARLKQARPNLEGRIDRAAGYLVMQLASPTTSRPIKCRIRRNGKRVYLVASLTSGGVTYEVNPADWSCTCRDFFRHGLGCKHSLAGYVLAKAAVTSPGTPPKPGEDGAQGDDGGGGEPDAPESQQTSQELTYEQVEAWLTTQRWKFAKTRPDNPHSYALKRNADAPEMFDRVVAYIQEKGMNYVWWGATYRQLVANGHCHWTMSGPGQAILINRKDLEQVRKDELRNKGGGGVQWRWLHGNIEEDKAELRAQEAGQDELTGGGA